MAITAHKNADELAFAAVTAFNLLKRELCGSVSTYPHCDITSTPSGSPSANGWIRRCSSSSRRLTANRSRRHELLSRRPFGVGFFFRLSPWRT